MRVLIIDGNATTRSALVLSLRKQGFADVAVGGSIGEAEVALRASPIDLAIVHLDTLPAEVLPRLRALDERLPLIAIADRPVGLADHVASDAEADALAPAMHRLIDAQRVRRRSLAQAAVETRRGSDPFVGTSDAIKMLAEQAHRLLDSHAPILIRGETGSGKGVLAHWFHAHGPRAEEAFVDINCAGLSREFLESELFGHERGAFTGALAAKLGLLDVAHRGTVFLDEIGEMDLALQPRLLKVLEDKRFRRLGDVRDRAVDIRLIAATHRDLGRRAREGTFRADLYYRINTLALGVPALRDRLEDLPLLVRAIAHQLGHDIELVPDALRAMQMYAWPGNVRELRNVIERAILISNRGRITPKELGFELGVELHAPPAASSTGDGDHESLTLVDAERRHIDRVMRLENGSVERAAVRLGVSRSTLYQKLRRYKTP